MHCIRTCHALSRHRAKEPVKNTDLMLRSAPSRVSKDGRESLFCVHPSRRLLRKLLRMRSVSLAASKAGAPVFRGVSDGDEKPQRTGYSAFAEYDGLREE